MNGRFRRMATATATLGALHAGACCLGFALLVLGFQAGLLRSIDILFYRGLVLIALAFAATFGGLALFVARFEPTDLRIRDVFAAAVLSLSFNLGFLIVVPVTVDRSISIFMLAQMAARPGEAFTPDAMSALFTKVYVGDGHQIDRRLHEQAVSGNVLKEGEGYRISPHGRLVIAMARIVAKLFDSHAGILAPDGPATKQPQTAAATP